MICNSCGNALDPLNRFCPKCGTPVQAQSPPPMGGPPLYRSPQTPMMGGPIAQPVKKSSCGKIIIIVGIILLVLAGGLAAAIYFGYHYAEKTLKSSEAYIVAVAALKENEEVKDQLGEIKGTGFPLGAFNTSADGSGNAAFVMSVQGTKASGKYEVNLVRSNSVWRLTKGVVRTNGGNIIQVADKRESNEGEINANNNANTDIDNLETSTTGKTVSGGVLNGKAITLPKPAYPPIARQVKASGTVDVKVLVDEKGNVVSARAVSGHPLLQAVSVGAARQAKFAPTRLAGKPVKVSGVITYSFTPE